MARRAAGLLRRGRLLAGVLVLGLLLRVAATVAVWPVHLTHPSYWDSLSFLLAAERGIYTDPSRTSGYPLFLRLAHAVSDEVVFTVALQHLLGLGSAALVYLAVRRLGMSSAVAAVPAAVLALGGDGLFLEHTLLSDALFILAISVVLYTAVRSLDPGSGRPAWLMTTGLALGGATLVRSAGLVLVAVIGLWLALALGGRARARLALPALTVAAALAVVGADAVLRAANSDYAGAGPAAGRSLYARVAQFADCDRFEPPRGTGALCEDQPPDSRPGPDYYVVDGGAPPKRLFGDPPGGDEELRSFARAAITGQPLEYLRAVAFDLVRYVAPHRPARPYSGLGPEVLRLGQEPAATPERVERVIASYYAPSAPSERFPLDALDSYGAVVRGHGALLPPALALIVAGLVLGGRRERVAIALFGGVGLALAVFPAAILSYNPRYIVPALAPLAAAAAVGIAAMASLAGPRAGDDPRCDRRAE